MRSAKRIIKAFVGRVVPLRLLGNLHVELGAFVGTVANYVLPWRLLSIWRAGSLRELKVHLGCGRYRNEGWYHVDFRSPKADLRVDIRRGLPFGDASCRFIFCEHVFDHLELGELRWVLSECHRVLEPDGAIRIILPDLERFVRAYTERDKEWVRAVWGRDLSPAESLNEIFFADIRKRFLHDFSSLGGALRQAGFKDVYLSAPLASRFPELNIDSNLPHRRLDSMYVEAVR
jgi:predicted SAM-dependent methyltransferase